MRALKYFVDEAFASLRRGYKTGLIATATIATAFGVLGGFLLVTTNVERALARWENTAEFSVYLVDAVSVEQRTAIDRAVRASAVVAGLTVVTKEEALRRFRENFGALADSAADLPANPLPESVEVRLRPEAAPDEVELLAGALRQMAGVADVRYDRRWIHRLMQAVRVIRTGGFVLAAVLVFAAALTVASVVRLALFARREEIHIMRLVGAPLAYIQGPFVVEGLIQGGIGAVVALAALWIVFLLARGRVDAWLAGAMDPASLAFLSLPVIAGFVAAGMGVGSIGGFIAARGTRESHE